MSQEKDYWTSRRTIRRYSQREVPTSLIEELLEKAAHAPTTGNMQLYSVVATRDVKALEALAPAHFCQPQVKGCAVALTFCADYHRFSRWCEERQAEPCYDNLQSFVAAFIDTIALAQQFNTLAEQRGLGVCWLGTTTYNAQEIAELLRLPELVVPLITLTVGWPAEEGVDVGRLPVSAFLHEETYRPCTAEEISRDYAEKEGREDSRAFVADNGKQTLAQVFTDLRYPRANCEAFSDKFAAFLRQSGFVK